MTSESEKQVVGWRAALKERFVTWALRSRPPEPSPVVLSQRRVYVLPTRAGLAYAASLLVLLIGAINYNLSLGYVLTFLLAGLGITAILHTFRNLVGLSIAPNRADPVFAGEMARFQFLIRGTGRLMARRAIRVYLADGDSTLIDVPADGETVAELTLPAPRRGWLVLPRIGLITTYPLGLIRTWAYCAPDFRCLVYPQPAASVPPLPWAAGIMGHDQHGGRGNDDFAGLRNHQAVDPPRHVAWKVAARQGRDAPLLTKQFDGAASARIWLEWDALTGHDPESRLAILTRWALDCHAGGLVWGMRLPGSEFQPRQGAAHLQQVLRALALFGNE